MEKWMSGIRGALLIIGLWVVGWALGYGGIMEIVDADGKIQDVWPAVFAIPGLIGGVIFALLVAGMERGRSFNNVPLMRFAIWGGVTGLVLGLLTIPAKVGDISPGWLGMTGIGIILGVIAGTGSGIFCRLVARGSSSAAAV